jgi:hypothetical protein
MAYKFECSLEKQDCATLYPSNQGRDPYKLPFTSQSCVRDNRLEGNIGRCGFPGAPCTVDSNKNDNCAGGAYCEYFALGLLIDLAYFGSQIHLDQSARTAHAEGQSDEIALPMDFQEFKCSII